MAPADNGGGAVTGYVLQRAYKDADDMMTDFMTIAATDAATWWNTLDCPMMNAAIPDDATPAPPADDADTDSPYCAMYDGLTDDAMEEVDAAFAADYGTITDTSYMDMGLMLDTTYYYRVAAMNAAGMGGYSDGMAYAMTAVSNTPPMADGTIDAVTVTEGMMSDAMDVSGYFSDADTGDTLTYTAASSDDMVATASVDVSMVTITGVAAGMATITVTATDAAGAYAMQTIMVTVEAANTPPMADGTIDAVTVTEGMMSDAMDVSGYFSDADTGDTLTYTAASSDDMVATASVDVSMVTITGVAAGMATITVTATDAAGAYAMQTIMVTVEAANTPPMADGTIDPVTVTAGEMSDAMDVSGYFTDADMDDTLTYTAMSDMEMYATADIPAGSSMLTITGVAAGSATVMVTATDPDGASVMQTIMVTVEAADTTLGNAMGLVGAVGSESNTIELTWTAGDNANIHWVFGIHTSNDTASLIWKEADASDSHTVDMTGKPRGSYTFFVIAGQTDDAGDAEWSAWTPGTVTY